MLTKNRYYRREIPLLDNMSRKKRNDDIKRDETTTHIRVYYSAYTKINKFNEDIKPIYENNKDLVKNVLKGKPTIVNEASESLEIGSDILMHKIMLNNHHNNEDLSKLLDLLPLGYKEIPENNNIASKTVNIVVYNKELKSTYSIYYMFIDKNKEWVHYKTEIYKGEPSEIPAKTPIAEVKDNNYISVDGYDKTLKLLVEKEILKNYEVLKKYFCHVKGGDL